MITSCCYETSVDIEHIAMSGLALITEHHCWTGSSPFGLADWDWGVDTALHGFTTSVTIIDIKDSNVESRSQRFWLDGEDDYWTGAS
jgi:hypothetical protein